MNMCRYVSLIFFTLMPCLCTGLRCDFESPCPWEGTSSADEHGFLVLSPANVSSLPRERGEKISAPKRDADNKDDGHYLYFRSRPNMKKARAMVISPWFTESELGCKLNMFVHMGNMQDGSYDIIIKANQEAQWTIGTQQGDNQNRWIQKSQVIGRVTQNFRILVEATHGSKVPSHIALDNLQLINCFPGPLKSSDCGENKFKCDSELCVDRDRVCDLTGDCLFAEDEQQSCDEMPESSMCTFEKGLCEWKNLKEDEMEWTLHNGTTPTERTGPSFDHTYKNISGSYLYIEASNYTVIGHSAILQSPVFPPPPRYHGDVSSIYHNVCKLRFFYHMFGTSIGSLSINVVEMHSKHPKERKYEIWEASKDRGNLWYRGSAIIPNITHRYKIQFVGSRGLRHIGDIAIDDISLSPECFGVNVPDNETVHYKIEPEYPNYVRNENITRESPVIKLSTCGMSGRYGPTQRECDHTYNHSDFRVKVRRDPFSGIQEYVIPESTIYTLIAVGASGGYGVKNFGDSKGGMVIATFNLSKGEQIYVLVGQKGDDACPEPPSNNLRVLSECARTTRLKRDIDIVRKFSKNHGGGGGGGGATYIFKIDPETKVMLPLLVGGGGGGLSHEKQMNGSVNPNSVLEESASLTGLNGYAHGIGAGSGGGWKDKIKHSSSGYSLFEGSGGGAVCKLARKWGTSGGFGGGGGACSGGGGGGGYTGGNSSSDMGAAENGRGGYSFINTAGKFANFQLSNQRGDGQMVIVKAFTGCGCKYLCVVIEFYTMAFKCICPENYVLAADELSCEAIHEKLSGALHTHHVIIIICGAVLLAIIIFLVLIFACHRYREHMAKQLQQEGLMNAELQLSRLRQATGGMVTEYNPNYEFGGGTSTVQDLKEVPRENMTLVKALGQGAFGEVYQGYIANVPDEPGNVPVAVKTLPELSSNQAEMDFLMEALIMSKFNHPNIVRFIGVCFEKLPRFIVLELLSGGDLKSFLRESRPKPVKHSNMNSTSALTMRDLLMLAIDVAKGCQYLEDNHFIHRDIAARNCLLTSKGGGRIVKIADFGMARDIYRADYYRKGGKAMLPVKWMPPEAFLDGIFTSKTDVWSFGVLLWEVMSLGYMPYPGRGNQEVMQLVTSGGRLEPPSNCPQPMYHIMTQCWHPVPDQRPNFVTILERLGYCLQDPDVLNSPLPVFYRPPSTERDTTVMRPNSETDGVCLQVQRNLTNSSSTDYLIPIPSSNYSISTEKTELQSPSSVESMAKLLEIDEPTGKPPTKPQLPELEKSLCWETSFNDGILHDLNGEPIESIPTPPPPPRSSILSGAVRPRRPEGYSKVPSQDDEIDESAFLGRHSNGFLMNEKSPNPSCNSICYSSSPNQRHMHSNGFIPDGLSSLRSLDKIHNPAIAKANLNSKKKKPEEDMTAPTEQRHSNLSLDASALCRQANGQPKPVPYVNVPISQSGRSNLPLVRALSCDRYSTNSLQYKGQNERPNQPSPVMRGRHDGEVNC